MKNQLRQVVYSQDVGSVPYGLPCLAVTRKTHVHNLQ
jgi:hypothetical protein